MASAVRVAEGPPEQWPRGSSGGITGFPYVHSADPKVLRYLGTAVNEGDENLEEILAIPASRSIHHRDDRRRDQACHHPAEFV